VPSKLYPVLAAGRPYIAAVEADSEVAALTAAHECGMVVSPGDAGALADAVMRLAADPAARVQLGARARAAAARFSRDAQVSRVAQVVRDVLSASC
jgi:colanic acid biosynthesis glycosyl transferase WcaI